jgi:hypothetical protein
VPISARTSAAIATQNESLNAPAHVFDGGDRRSAHVVAIKQAKRKRALAASGQTQPLVGSLLGCASARR